MGCVASKSIDTKKIPAPSAEIVEKVAIPPTNK